MKPNIYICGIRKINKINHGITCIIEFVLCCLSYDLRLIEEKKFSLRKEKISILKIHSCCITLKKAKVLIIRSSQFCGTFILL